jgi:hypothetical protein
MKAVAVVTGCDRRYLDFLLELLANFRDLGVARTADVYVFDIDFTEADRARLAPFEVTVKRIVGEPIEIRPKDPHRRHLVGTVRLAMREVFPGHDTYLYLDVDTWMQERRALEGWIDAAAGGRLVLAPEVHPVYRRTPDRWIAFHRRFYPDLGEKMARQRAWNGGVFACRANSLDWSLWIREYLTVVNRGEVWFGAAQSSLTYLEMTGALTPLALPAIYNWTVHRAVPMWEIKTRRLVSPIAPFEPILLIHLTGPTKYARLRVPTSAGSGLLSPLRYPDFVALRDGRHSPDRALRRLSLVLQGKRVWPEGRLQQAADRWRRRARRLLGRVWPTQ